MAAAGWRKWVPGRRAVVVLVVVLAVLAGGGYAAKPLWQPWWYATNVCAGLLSADDLAEVLPTKQLQAAEEEADLAHGRMKCGVNTSDHEFSLMARVESDPGEVDRLLSGEFTIPTPPRFVFPAGIPGFHAGLGHYLVQECPDLGRDSLGRNRRLVTWVNGKWDEKHGTPATLRIAVSLANGAAEKAGCGAPRLPLPQRAVLRPTAVPLEKGGAGCGWLARARLPEKPGGKHWRVIARTDPHAAVTSCALVDGTSGAEYADVQRLVRRLDGQVLRHTDRRQRPAAARLPGRRPGDDRALRHRRPRPLRGRVRPLGGEQLPGQRGPVSRGA
ncbi:hypothetical protein RB199_10800 [Streptomyces libani]